MKKYDYYTPVELAKCILNLLPNVEVRTMIDICCGSWNLLSAAKERYENAYSVGVDIDEKSSLYKIENSEFVLADGRDFALTEKKKGNKYDLILSNPPFGLLKDEERKFNSNEDIKQGCYLGLFGKRYEEEMIQANFFLAHESSVLVFILPNTFVEGYSCIKARCQIAKDYNILSIIKLPSNAFGRGAINTFAIIMSKGNVNRQAILYQANNIDGWSINQIGKVVYGDILKGKWWLGQEISSKTENIIIYRGNISSNLFAEKGDIVLHNTKEMKCSCKWQPSIRYYNSKNLICNRARKGDILINRIGKAAGYWCSNTIEGVIVSDCIIVVVNTIKDLDKIFFDNSDKDGRLKVPIRGLATPYVTAQDIKNIIIQSM